MHAMRERVYTYAASERTPGVHVDRQFGDRGINSQLQNRVFISVVLFSTIILFKVGNKNWRVFAKVVKPCYEYIACIQF